MIKHAVYGGGAATTAGDVGLALLRVSVGVFIAYHGLQKLPVSQGFIDNVAGLGFPQPTLFAWLAALTECVGGLLLAVGFLTRFVALALVFNMGVAAFVVHKGLPFVAPQPGDPSKELPMMYLFPFLAFVLTGAGRLSVDGFLRGPRPVVVRETEVIEPTTRRVI